MTFPSLQDVLLLPDFASMDPIGLAAKLDKKLVNNQQAIEQLLKKPRYPKL